MNVNFQKATLLARMADSFLRQKKDMFNRTTRQIVKGEADRFSGSMESMKSRLAEYEKDIRDGEALLAELRTEIVRLSEGGTRRNGSVEPAADTQ